jgi:hypothetical protein
MWPVAPEFLYRFEEIKWMHEVQPLLVYREGKYIEPEDVPAAMKDTIVQVFFELVHYKIMRPSDGSGPQDSFSVRLIEIIILEPGRPKPRTPSPAKRRDLRAGPSCTKKVYTCLFASSGTDLLTLHFK